MVNMVKEENIKKNIVQQNPRTLGTRSPFLGSAW